MNNNTQSENITQQTSVSETESNENSSVAAQNLSPREFRAYNHMAQTMKIYHDHFRMEWEYIYNACKEDQSSEGQEPHINTSQLARMIVQFISHLTAHHNIEEHHIFPVLGEKMPMFRHSESSSPAAVGPIEQHREIHAGLDKLDDYLAACRAGEKEFQRQEVKEILDGFGEVLWKHLDDEVAHLGAENMRKYWSIEEMRMMPM